MYFFVLFYVFFVLFYVLFVLFYVLFVLFHVFLCCSMYCFCVVLCIVYVDMCTELLSPGGYPIAVKYIIHIISYIKLALDGGG
jgi:hypothetical protein